MARRNRNKQKSKDNNNTVNTEVIAQKVEQLQKDSEISTEELMSEEDVQVPSNLKIKSLESIYQQAIKVHKQLETRKIEYSKKITSVDEQMEKLKKEINDYETKKLELNESIKKYDDELKEINKLRIGNFVNIIDKKVIDEYSKSLDEQKELLLIEIKKLKNEQAKYLQLIANKEQEIISSKTEITKEKLRLEREFEIKFTEKEQELEESKRKIEKQQKELQYSLEDFEDEKKYLEDKARKKVENEIITLKDSISTLEQKNSLLLEEIEELKDIYRYLGGRDPKKIIDELNDAKDEIYSLQGKLELSPDSLDIDELKKLRRDKINWKADLDEAYASLNDYKPVSYTHLTLPTSA
jgi:chromosome segregation ATPase